LEFPTDADSVKPISSTSSKREPPPGSTNSRFPWHLDNGFLNSHILNALYLPAGIETSIPVYPTTNPTAACPDLPNTLNINNWASCSVLLNAGSLIQSQNMPLLKQNHWARDPMPAIYDFASKSNSLLNIHHAIMLSDGNYHKGNLMSPSSQTSSSTSSTCPFIKNHVCAYVGCHKEFGTACWKPFACNLCDKAYTTNNRLTVHMRDHSGQKCSLNTHMITHLDPELKREIRRGNKRILPCRECGKLYKHQQSREHHMWKAHGLRE
ncbi:hypothetical protein BDR26DRAFT_862758, partial [Obelidium mucronatum]